MSLDDWQVDARSDPYDRLLQRMHAYSSELANGFTNHAPMVVEALFALGHGDLAEAWLERYLPGARPKLAPAEPVSDQHWQAALGSPAREAAWLARFGVDIAAHGWPAALGVWTPRLAPGFAAAAAHGVIRTAHAARALARRDTPSRRAELAAGLAVWASTWQVLPGDPLARSGTLNAGDALAAVPLVPAAKRRNRGAITTALTVLADEPGFARALGALAPARSADELSSALAGAFADTFLDQVHSTSHAIVFTHAITGVAAARRLAPWAGQDGTLSLLAYAWQTGAALHACFSDPHATGSRPDARVSDGIAIEALVEAAVRHGDEHVIKLAEACLEFHRVSGDPRFPAVVARALEVVPRD